MPPRRSPRQAAKHSAESQIESSPALKEAQSSFANALSSRGKGGQIVEVVIPVRRKRKAVTLEAAPTSPPAKTNEAGEEEELEDDEDDAPEPVSMKSGRVVAEEEAKKVKDFQESATAKRREANRKRDQALKERADAQGSNRKKRKTAEGEEPAKEIGLEEAANIPLPPSDDATDEKRDAESRMERAMAQADEEDEEEEDEDDEQGDAEARMERAMAEADEEDEDEESEEEAKENGDTEAEDVEMDEQDDDATAVSGEAPRVPRRIRLDGLVEADAAVGGPSAPRAIPRQLPDHLFASAAAAISEAQKKERSQKKVKKTQKVKDEEKKKRRRESLKERVVGSRTVRVLPSQTQPDTGAKSGIAAARFVRQRLNLTKPQNGLKKQKNIKGWERRAAHLALSQGSTGPAKGFARSLMQ